MSPLQKFIVHGITLVFASLLCLGAKAQDENLDFDLDKLLAEIDKATSSSSGGFDGLVTNDVTSFFYHPSSQLGLGKGIGNGNPVTYKQKCFDFDTISSQDQTTAIETKFERTEIKSFRELRETLNFSGSISARLKFANKAGGDLGLDFAKGHTFSEDSLMIVLKMEANFAQHEVDNLVLRDTYQQRLNEGKYDLFLRSCGSHLVTSVDRKAMVFAVIRSDNMSESAKNEIKASLGLSADLPFASGEVKSNAEDLFEREQKRGRLSISFHAIGGGGPQQLGQLATAHSPEDIQGAFKSYLENFQNENVPAIVFNVTPMGDLLPEYGQELDSQVRNINGALVKLLDDFEQVTLELQKLKSGLVGGRLPDNDKLDYIEWVKSRLERQKQLKDIAGKFLNQKDYEFSNDPDYQGIAVNGALPTLSAIKWYKPTVLVHKSEVKVKCRANTECNVQSGRWATLDGSLWLGITISPVEQVESIELQAVFDDGRIFDIPDSLRTREEIYRGSLNGFFNYRILEFTKDKNYSLYKRLRTENPIFSLKVIRADKTEQVFRLDPMVLEGSHQ